jgi:hypothetical protein
MSNQKEKSTHILNASANLLGLCFIVLTSLKIGKLWEASIIDELTAGAIMIFMVSCILSFLSIRSKTEMSATYEKYADFLFLSGLFLMFATTVLILFNIIK